MDHSGTPIRHRLERLEENLSSFSARSCDALRRQSDRAEATGYRPSYALDVDRIINSQAYTRYIDKTQVFSLIQNDHLTHRVLHVQLVSRIARTVGRALGLNEDLIEAISLGHDIGHPPSAMKANEFYPPCQRMPASARSITTSKASAFWTPLKERERDGTSPCRPWTASSATTERATTFPSPRITPKISPFSMKSSGAGETESGSPRDPSPLKGVW